SRRGWHGRVLDGWRGGQGVCRVYPGTRLQDARQARRRGQARELIGATDGAWPAEGRARSRPGRRFVSSPGRYVLQPQLRHRGWARYQGMGTFRTMSFAMNRQAIAALFLLVLNTGYFVQALALPRPFQFGEPGPAFLPLILSGVLFVASGRILYMEL